MSFLSIYQNYLNKLELISLEHDELTDTDVRERLHEVINWYFIWGNPIDADFPKKYAMFSLKADKKVAKVTRYFIEEACKVVSDVPVGQARNDLIENHNIQTNSGSSYDEFLGSGDEVLPAKKPSSDEYYGDYN